MMNLNALKIDPEFQGKIPPLNFEEEQQLEQNILHEGRLLNPIIIWSGFILDGHTRCRIHCCPPPGSHPSRSQSQRVTYVHAKEKQQR